MINIEMPRKISGSGLLSSTPNQTGSSRPERRRSSSIRPVKEKVLYYSKSIQLCEYTFEDEQGRSKSAEVIRKRYMVGVNNTSESVEGDHAILSIAILKRHCLCDCLILVRQYRPTLKSYALEFPACIIERLDREDSGDLAMKEIEENTGYGSTTVRYISPATATDPELCDSKVKLVSMSIDGDDPIKNNFNHKNNHQYHNNNNNNHNADSNGNGGQNLEDGQMSNANDADHDDDGDDDDDDKNIEVILLPINGLLDRLNEYCKNDTIVDSRVYSFAIGLKKGERMSQNASKPENIEIAI